MCCLYLHWPEATNLWSLSTWKPDPRCRIWLLRVSALCCAYPVLHNQPQYFGSMWITRWSMRGVWLIIYLRARDACKRPCTCALFVRSFAYIHSVHLSSCPGFGFESNEKPWEEGAWADRGQSRGDQTTPALTLYRICRWNITETQWLLGQLGRRYEK